MMKRHYFLLLLQSLLLLTVAVRDELGGEKAFYDTVQMAPVTEKHRQNVCDRYEKFENGTVALGDALEGLQLRLAMAAYKSAYFNYDFETGIDRDYPGMQAVVLDELARRGGWTWRDSFGITTNPAEVNHTWLELLEWSIDVYDLHISWWAPNRERLRVGSAIVHEWYDASIILVAKERPEEVQHDINFWNWLRPYDSQVWMATVFTIFISGIVYQILEWYGDDRQDRSMWEWFSENFYMSALNFTQAYEYQPKTFASRLFGVSMAIWALVMTATYTANLASLLVDRKPPPYFAETIDEVAVFGKRICTWEGTIADSYLKHNYPNAKRIPLLQNVDGYKGLHNGQCDYVADVVTNWHRNKGLKEYNPYCDLFWVGGDRIVHELKAGFVGKVDSGKLCSGFIRDVLSFHMYEMWNDGFMDQAWDTEFKHQHDLNCDTYDPSLIIPSEDGNLTHDEASRRLRAASSGRQLKGGGGKGAAGGAVAAVSSAAAGGDDSPASQALTLESMIGTFAFHWALSLIALVLASANALYVKWIAKRAAVVEYEYEQSIDDKSPDCAKSRQQRPPECSVSFTTMEESRYEHESASSHLSTTMEKPHGTSNLRSQLTSMQESQFQVEKSQAQMHKCQTELGQNQKELGQIQQRMLEEQQKLQRQIGALLAASALSSYSC